MIASTNSRKAGDATMLFDFFKPKKSASASHILVKGNDPKFLTDLKGKYVYNKSDNRSSSWVILPLICFILHDTVEKCYIIDRQVAKI